MVYLFDLCRDFLPVLLWTWSFYQKSEAICILWASFFRRWKWLHFFYSCLIRLSNIKVRHRYGLCWRLSRRWKWVRGRKSSCNSFIFFFGDILITFPLTIHLRKMGVHLKPDVCSDSSQNCGSYSKKISSDLSIKCVVKESQFSLMSVKNDVI